MIIDPAADTRPEPQPGVSVGDLVQLAINVGFYTSPVFVDPDDRSSEPAMKVGPPFIRFPVQLSTKDAGIIEQLLAHPVAFVAFEIQDSNGKTGYYRLVATK